MNITANGANEFLSHGVLILNCYEMFVLILFVAFRAPAPKVEVYGVGLECPGHAGSGIGQHFVCRNVVDGAALLAEEMCVRPCVAVEVGIALVDGEHQGCILLGQEFQGVIDGGFRQGGDCLHQFAVNCLGIRMCAVFHEVSHDGYALH